MQLQEFSGLLQELNKATNRDDVTGLHKRLAVLNALGERYLQLSDSEGAEIFYRGLGDFPET